MAERKSCDLCPKNFADSSGLFHHMQTHSEGKKYNCSQCNKSFSRNGQLKTHSLIHTVQLQLFNCNMCPKTFKRQETVKRHLEWVHVEISQYGCNICEHKSKTKGDLKKHVSQVHNSQPETCQLCQKVVNRLYTHNYNNTIPDGGVAPRHLLRLD